MRRLPTVLTALALAVAPLTSAAADHASYWGGCRLDGAFVAGPAGAYHLSAFVVATDAAGTPQPYSLHVRCDLYVDGLPYQSASGSGTGVVAFSEPVRGVLTSTMRRVVCTEAVVDGHIYRRCEDVPAAAHNG